MLQTVIRYWRSCTRRMTRLESPAVIIAESLNETSSKVYPYGLAAITTSALFRRRGGHSFWAAGRAARGFSVWLFLGKRRRESPLVTGTGNAGRRCSLRPASGRAVDVAGHAAGLATLQEQCTQQVTARALPPLAGAGSGGGAADVLHRLRTLRLSRGALECLGPQVPRRCADFPADALGKLPCGMDLAGLACLVGIVDSRSVPAGAAHTRP